MLAECGNKLPQKIDALEIDFPKALSESLVLLGNALKIWDGKNLEDIAKPSGLALTYCTELFKRTNDKEYLFCHLIIQYTTSMLFSKIMLSGSFGLQIDIPLKKYSDFGDEFIKAGKSMGTNAFHSSLLDILAYAYGNQLVPVV
jgi:hypothetical protein